MFADESKSNDYLLVTVSMVPEGLQGARNSLNALRLNGQSRLHMVHERDPRRRLILSTLSTLGVKATIYCAAAGSAKTQLELRDRCLDGLVHDLALLGGSSQICLELDESLQRRDRIQLFRSVQREGAEATMRYRHERAAQEPLLAIPDAIAWAWARGGQWRRRAAALVGDVRNV